MKVLGIKVQFAEKVNNDVGGRNGRGMNLL
jgi:hypothetical protein